MSASGEVLLVARGLERRFGKRVALAGVDLELRRGETLALVGPNGAGKSTLLSLLAGALRPSGGSIEWSGHVRTGWAPQRPALYGRLSARENLELFARLEGEREPREAAGRLLSAFDLRDERAAADLSVGTRQRLNLALALLGDPDVLLLDEPTASLDPEQRARLWALLGARRDEGRALVASTQDPEEVRRHADRVAALEDGRLSLAAHAGDLAGTAARRSS